MSSDVAPQGRRPPKTATDYLAASGATAIAVTEIDGICTFRIGHKVDFAISVHWALITMAKSIVNKPGLMQDWTQTPPWRAGRRRGL
jgi:hypothetical protein